MKTGRQRKRMAARSKGGEFQARRRKRRVYFCCIGSEIDVEKLADRCDKNSFFNLINIKFTNTNTVLIQMD